MYDWSRCRPLISPSSGFSRDAYGVKASDLVLISTLIELECAIRVPPRRFDCYLALADVSIYVCKEEDLSTPEHRRQRAHRILISALSPSQALAWINCEACISSIAQNLTPQHLLVAG
jgi:hypothetical protein